VSHIEMKVKARNWPPQIVSTGTKNRIASHGPSQHISPTPGVERHHTTVQPTCLTYHLNARLDSIGHTPGLDGIVIVIARYAIGTNGVKFPLSAGTTDVYIWVSVHPESSH
jgi:hypothetical protein